LRGWMMEMSSQRDGGDAHKSRGRGDFKWGSNRHIPSSCPKVLTLFHSIIKKANNQPWQRPIVQAEVLDMHYLTHPSLSQASSVTSTPSHPRKLVYEIRSWSRFYVELKSQHENCSPGLLIGWESLWSQDPSRGTMQRRDLVACLGLCSSWSCLRMFVGRWLLRRVQQVNSPCKKMMG
jgi:hypothetical protein